jgi:nucleotide-binding universal stress UspA family protein
MMNNLRTSGDYRLKDLRADKKSEVANHPFRIRRILVPIRLLADEKRAIEYAVAWASRFGAELTLLYVYEEKKTDFSLNIMDDTIVDENQERAEDALREWCTEISEIYPNCDMCFRCGTPREEIVFAANDLDADLIVVSIDKHSWHRPLVDKGEVEKLLSDPPCPVLVVR